jgi:DNA polymerase-3 subunit epsilon
MINKYLKPLLGISDPNEQIEVEGIYYDHKQNIFNPIEVDLRFEAILAEINQWRWAKTIP